MSRGEVAFLNICGDDPLRYAGQLVRGAVIFARIVGVGLLSKTKTEYLFCNMSHAILIGANGWAVNCGDWLDRQSRTSITGAVQDGGSMPDKSAIEWTDATWNPVTGCTKVSPGCAYCYAEALTLRFKRGGPFLPGRATINLHFDRLDAPKRWKSPRRIFVNSMSDLFHEEVPFEFVKEIFDRMCKYRQHTYQVLTKRPERLLEYLRWNGARDWPSHVWAGVSVENQYWADQRIPALLDVPAAVRFLSVEPLLKPVDLRTYLPSLQWVIVGGESGHAARPMDPEWVRRIRDDCFDTGVPFFFKQWGGRHSKAGGRELDRAIWDEMPVEPVGITDAADRQDNNAAELQENNR